MKLLRASFVAATLKTFRHVVRNSVSPPNVNPYKVMFRGFAAESESAMIAASCNEKKVGEAFGSFNGGVIKGLCREERLEEVFEEMNRKGLAPDCEAYNALICAMCKGRNPIRAIELYDQMRVRGLSPNEMTYTSLIDLLCQWSADKAYKVLSEMIVCGFSPSAAIYNNIVRSYCHAHRVEEAVGILRAMAERGLSPDAASYNTVISKFCKDKKLEKAVEIKVEMIEKGILPNDVTYSALIQCLCLQERLPEAFDLFQEMLRKGLSPSKYIYTRLMNAYCLVGEFSKAFHLHDEMTKKGFLPDFVTGFSPSLVTFNAIIYGLCSLDRAEDALEILRSMEDMGLTPDGVSYSTIISGFCLIGELRKAYELKVEIDEKHIWWLDEGIYDSLMKCLSDEVTFSSLINDYIAEGDMHKVYMLDSEMKHGGYLPSITSFTLFIDGLSKSATTSDAKGLLLWLISSQCLAMPAGIVYDTLIENCSNDEFKSAVGCVKDLSARGLVNEAAIAHERMINMNYKPEGAVYNLLIFDHCRSHNVDKAYEMYKEMMLYGFSHHMFSVIALINVLHSSGRYDEMGWVIRNTLRSCNLADSELHKVLDEINIKECDIDALLDVLAEIPVNGLLLDGGKCASTKRHSGFTPAITIIFLISIVKGVQDVFQDFFS